jgi:hypothetical protein
MKKKIAIEISGHLRTFLKNIDNWKENIFFDDIFEYYFFLNTYDSYGSSNGWTTKIDNGKKIYKDEVKKIKDSFQNIDLFIEDESEIDLIRLDEENVTKSH